MKLWSKVPTINKVDEGKLEHPVDNRKSCRCTRRALRKLASELTMVMIV